MRNVNKAKWFFIFAILGLNFNTAWASNKPSLLVFSDMDDTTKITHVREFMEKAAHAVFKDSLFYGSNTVYQALRDHYEAVNGPKTSQFSYITNGIAFMVEETHGAILHNYEFPNPDRFFSRSWSEMIHKRPHKYDEIIRQVRDGDPSVVVLIGDNGEKDPRIYQQVKRKIEKIAQARGKEIKVHTLIHIVYGPTEKKASKLYEGQIPYHNAGDLALYLNDLGLLDKSAKDRIVADVRRQIKDEGLNRVYGELVYPSFKYRNLGLLAAERADCALFYKK